MSATSRPIELSLSALGREFGVTRETVRSKLAKAGFSPVASPLQVVPAQDDLVGAIDDKTAATVFYRLRDAIKAFLADPADNEPCRMNPLQRKQHYQALREQQEFEVQAGRLIPVQEVEDEQARIIKIFVLAIETLPDILERDCGLTGDAVARVERVLDSVREQLYQDTVAPLSPQPPADNQVDQ